MPVSYQATGLCISHTLNLRYVISVVRWEESILINVMAHCIILITLCVRVRVCERELVKKFLASVQFRKFSLEKYIRIYHLSVCVSVRCLLD